MSEELTQVQKDAKAQGWNPDFEGANAKTAEEFLEVGSKISAVQADNNKKLLEKVESLETTITGQAQSFDDFQKQHFKTVQEAKKSGYDKAVKDIEKKQLQAVEDSDTDTYKELDKEKKNLEKPKAEPATPKRPPTTPEMTQWYKENKWLKLDSNGEPLDVISMAAVNYDLLLTKTRPDLEGIEFLKEIEKNIKTTFPDQFKAPAPKLDTGGHPSTPKGDVGYKDLPAEAKQACDMFVKDGMMTKEEYVKSYNEENEVE